MCRYILAVFLLINLLMPLTLIEGSNFSTRLEYKQINGVPKDLLYILEPFKLIGDKYYFIGSKDLNWFQAAQECRQLGGNLVHLSSNVERQLIGYSSNLDTNQTYWLDLSNLGQKEYVSIATGSAASYLQWLSEDWEDKDHTCVSLVNDYQDGFVMKKSDCWEKARFICQLSTPRTVSLAIW